LTGSDEIGADGYNHGVSGSSPVSGARAVQRLSRSNEVPKAVVGLLDSEKEFWQRDDTAENISRFLSLFLSVFVCLVLWK